MSDDKTEMKNTPVGGPVYSIVVPVYNSEKTLPIHYGRIVSVMEGVGESFELIYVEDGGQDHSWQVLQGLAEKDPRVRVIQLMHNHGQARAIMCGFAHATGQFIITMDDDLQHPPEEIPSLIQAMQHRPNADVITGVYKGKKHALWRGIGSRVLNIINTHVFKKKHSLAFSSFRIIRRQIVEYIMQQNVPQPAIGALLMSITPRIENITVRHEPRSHGKSGYTLSKIFTLTLSDFLAFSVFPLRFLAMIGIFGVGGSIIAAAYYIVRYISGGIVPGFTTVVLLQIGAAGFIFFAFGLVGEYLLRILQSVHFTPQYIVRQKMNFHSTLAAGENLAEPTTGKVDNGSMKKSTCKQQAEGGGDDI